MAIKDLTGIAVLQAIQEYQSLGGERFLNQYGYAAAKRYWLQHEGELFPSKAIAGVAHRYISSNARPMKSEDFTGGEGTVVKVLTDLGFSVVDRYRHVISSIGERVSNASRVWVTSFWGFDPEKDGYLGFTRDGDRRAFIAAWQPGDLVMIYATSGHETPDHLKGRILGFLEVSPKQIRDVDRMSPESRAWKAREGLGRRWTHALPVLKAWRTVDPPVAKAIAPVTLGPSANFQLLASRGQFLTDEEASRALAIEIRPTDVFGLEPLSAEEKAIVSTPSRGFPISFGRRNYETVDGEHFLYALKLECDVSAVVGEPTYQLRGKAIIKVGLAKNPMERCAQLNCAFPPDVKLRWRPILQSKPISSGEAALDAETALKAAFAQKYRSLGGEFFLCDERTLAANFTQQYQQW